MQAPTTLLAITPLYLGLAALLVLALSFAVSLRRMRHKVSLGDGDIPELACAIRAFGNCVEYLPLLIMITAAVEISGAPGWVVHAFGAATILSRAAHGLALMGGGGASPLRFWSMIVTLLILLLGGLGLIGRALL